MDQFSMKEKENIALDIRRNIVQMLGEAKSGHPGGSLSAVEILVNLYFDAMNIDPKNPQWADRDRFVLAKGHAAPVLYAALAARGYFPKDELKTLRKLGSRLQGHPDMHLLPGVDISTGSLGQGGSVAVGMALAGKVDAKDYFVYLLWGDGELQEGQVWEAAMAAAHYKLGKIIGFVDHNGLQIDGDVTQVMNPTPIDEKFKAFGWHVQTADGHSLEALKKATAEAKTVLDKPSVVVCKTVKGKGVSFMENNADWHGSAPNADQVRQALDELAQKLA
ncbi:MAG: transketolase [Peptococcaceae bacterium]|jgi:transketolase|nr:transketolase [Peptococcaceae bacterium]